MTDFEGICMSQGKFLKPWQVTHKIIEWIFSQFTFNILWMTLTQNIITCRASKNSWMDMRGCVWVGKIFLKTWQVTDKKKKCNHKIRVQEHNGGQATSHQWCHMMSRDIIGMIGGWGVSYRGVCHAKLPVWNIGPILQCYCHHPSYFN